MSVVILQGLESVVSASHHRHGPLVHQDTPHCTHKPPTSHSSANRSAGPREFSGGSKEVLSASVMHAGTGQPHSMAQRQVQRSYVPIQNAPSSTAMGCLGLPSWIALLSPRETVLCLLPSPQTPPSHWHAILGHRESFSPYSAEHTCSAAVVSTCTLPRSLPVPMLVPPGGA